MINSTEMRILFRVSDFDRSVHFYRDLLEMDYVSGWDRDDGAGILLQAGDGRIVELFGPPRGQQHDERLAKGVELAFQVTDVDSWHHKLNVAGIPIARELVDNPWGDRSFGIDDPDGVRIWLFQLTGEEN